MKKRILVVDDVPDWRATLQSILRDYEVKAVGSYQEAMEVISNREAELVIVDLRLSPNDEEDRQGMQLLQQLYKHRINAIVLTGYSEHSLQQQAEETYQAFDFLDKSIVAGNMQRLRDIVSEAFKLMEKIEIRKTQAIRDAGLSRPVAFTEDLVSWPIRKFRNNEKE